MGKFAEFLKEQDNEKPYRLLNLIHDTPDDPNKTGDEMVAEAEKLGISTYQLKVNGGYFSVNEKGNLMAHNFSVEELQPNQDSSDKKIEHDKKGWEINPENTICIIRVALGRGAMLSEQLRMHNVKTINTSFCHMVCDDKWLNYVALYRAGLKQPKSFIISHEENLDTAIEKINGKYPMILKTTEGTKGVGVVYIDSRKTLLATVQLINKIDENINMIVQEYIKTPYDVRVMVLNGEVVAQLQRDVIKDDFRSNISQGQEPKKIKLTELAKSQCVKAAEAVKGTWVGVDFIPSKNREKEPPYFIEVNSSPGTKYINELNDINVHKMVVQTFKNRDNWRKL